MNDTRQTYINSQGEQITIKCENCNSLNMEFEEISEDETSSYYCEDCGYIVLIKEGNTK